MQTLKNTNRIATETRTELKAGINTYFNGQYEKPMSCPYCGVHTDAIGTAAQSFHLSGNRSALVVAYQCTRCKKQFLAVYIEEDNRLTLNTIIPVADADEVHPGLKTVSPEFERIHQQSYRAELRGDIDIAAVGYRTALEVLIKDFAIRELGEEEEEVASKKLAQAIEDYSGTVGMKNAENVVRKLGNDYTHYRKKYEPLGFMELKHYYGIVLRALGVQYDMKHVPV